VFPVQVDGDRRTAFRLLDHYQRLVESCKIIGIDTFASQWSFERFIQATRDVIAANAPTDEVYVRATVHVDESIPGTRVRGLHTTVSIFLYDANPIVPQNGMRLKTSVWRRIPDYAIPSRAKVNGAYVNSVLAKQDAIDSGFDDCIFLDINGHVCELSAANIFLVRNGVLITPDVTSDILDGINRRTILTLAREEGMTVQERTVDLTELYIADEVFVCGTSAGVAPVYEIDGRAIGTKESGPVTLTLRKRHQAALTSDEVHGWVTTL
jgi:branched-chain amino acid aminotransferase